MRRRQQFEEQHRADERRAIDQARREAEEYDHERARDEDDEPFLTRV